jgi:hypothetical protein
MKNEVPAEPIAPEEQAEIKTVLLIASVVAERGRYTEPFADAVRALNGVCARIHNAPDPSAPPVEIDKEAWA